MPRNAKRVALYLRVSTDKQTTENQKRDLGEWAERAGHEVVEVYRDHGISGTKGRDKRLGFDRMMTAATQQRFNMIAAWSLDRLGRSTRDLANFAGDIQERGIDLYLHKQAIDTSTAAGRLFFGILASIAEFEREMIVDRVRAGLERARAEGKRPGMPKGWRKAKVKREDEILRLRHDAKMSIRDIGRTLKVSPQTVQKVIKKHKAGTVDASV